MGSFPIDKIVEILCGVGQAQEESDEVFFIDVFIILTTQSDK